MEGCRVTDTPIYDQIQWEFRSVNTSTDQPTHTAAPSSRRQDTGRRTVSVWALVDEHRRRS
jgi:hypothetical protein